MMASTSTRRPISRQPTKLPKPHPVTTPNQLANEFATKLIVAKKLEEGEVKAVSMRGVNEASQALSGVVQSGWKKSSTNSNGSKTMLTTASSAASMAAKHLSSLRRILPGDLDIERAATSVVGKLVALEMFEQAKVALSEMQPRLCHILNVAVDQSSLLSIPEPPSPPANPILLNLVSVYLLHAIIIMTQPDVTAQDLSTVLNSPKTSSLLSWLPALSSLPAKHTDSLLTRTYTAINTLTSSSSLSSTKSKPTTSPESIFTLRIYALRCLAHTTPGTIDANTFWNQATRHTGMFVKATPPKGEEQTTSMILHAFDELVQLAEQRADRDVFLAVEEKGKGFLGFCENWASFANRAGDISLLKKVNDYMKQPSSSPSPSGSRSPSSEKKTLEKEVILEGTKACSLFSHAVLLLENPDTQESDLLQSLRECTEVLQTSETMNILLQPGLRSLEVQEREQQAALRMCGKVDRALEKLRRSAIKYLEAHPVSSPGQPTGTVDDSLRVLLAEAINCFHSVLTSADLTAASTRDLLTRSLDTLFVLSRTKLNINEPSSFVSAFDTLSLAATILDTVPQDRFPISPASRSVDVANYMRCISGAFYNLAGSLYQASRYGNAVPFLVESCELGAKSLRLPRPVQEMPNESREKEWNLLEEQLFRRWEILGVCYAKNGDRKNAYNAFKQSIHTFPFQSSGLTSQCDWLPPDLLFGPSASSAVKQLVSLIDRVSYMGACDLLLPAEEVSLLSAINCAPSQRAAHGAHPTIMEPCVTGALLERQLDSLEPSQWKEGVRGVSTKLIQDALSVYSTGGGGAKNVNSMPVRTARMLVRCLELLYREQGESLYTVLGFGNVEEIGEKVEELLRTNSLGKDVHLAQYVSQYRITGHLWMALHAHRRADPLQISIISQHTDEACKLMKILLSQDTEGATPKAARTTFSPKVGKKGASPKIVGRIVSPKPTRVTRQRVPAAPRKAVSTKAKPALNPVTPKPRTRTALQPVSFAVNQAPRYSVDGSSVPSQHTLMFDNFSKFVSLLQMTSSILGSLSLILPKARLLDMTRKLAQRSVGPTSDEYVIASLDLAHEYVILGKTRRASSIFYPALEVVRSGKVSDDVAVRFLLRFAESLVVIEDIPQSSKVYLEALAISDRMTLEQKTTSTHQKVYARVKILEVAATASHVFSLIQHNLGENYASIEGLLQSLRLWNRAVEALNRLNPSRPGKDSDPFEMSNLKDALPTTSDSSTPPPNSTTTIITSTTKNLSDRRHFADGLEWRISEGLLSTMFALSQAYFLKGSAREAEYFAKQAADLAKQMNAPSMTSRALTRQGEIQLHMGHLEEAQANLTSASVLLADIPGLETVEVRRLKAECRLRSVELEGTEEEDGEGNTQEMYNETVAMLEDLDSAFRQFDNLAIGPRRSIGMSPGGKARVEVLAPELLASLLSQQLWLLRDNVDETFNSILEKLISLSYSIRNKAEESALMGKLTLHGVYDRFRNDMFLSSLTESTIAIPMGMKSKEDVLSTVQPADVVDALADAQKFFWEHLSMTASNGNTIKIRDAAISLALVGAFRTSLGDKRIDVSSMISSLLDISVALTLRRDMLEFLPQKFPPTQHIDDLQWPLLLEDGSCLPRSVVPSSSKFSVPPESESESDEDDVSRIKDAAVKTYWENVHANYRRQALQPSKSFTSHATQLPNEWVVINITVTSDKGTLFISRQDGGSEPKEPLVFGIPLKGRRDHGDGEDENHLTFEGALQELQDIVHASDECTKSAVNIKADDEEARSNWWKTRGQLDVRMRELLENIEYCWLGAFKTILSPRADLSSDQTSELRSQFEKVFYRGLHVKDKKPKPKAKPAHKKSASQPQFNTPHEFSLDDAIIKCFSTLSPKSRDEELEDFVYFVLDLYQFHGVPVAIAEIDIDQLVIDIRTVLEEHCARTNKNAKSSARWPANSRDEHIFLVLDKNVQGLPWESIPILRGRSVSRIPGIQFLHDRLEFAKLKRESAGHKYEPREGAVVDGKKGYYVLNPSGDLGRTEERFRDWAKGMKSAGWDGVIGKGVTEQPFVNALKTQDIVVYFGHGGGEQYIRSHKIRSLQTCAATMLWGCSSGALRDMGDFDRTGTPYNYILAGCPTLVANLWDVTDKDIDKICQAVFDKVGLTGKDLLKQQTAKNTTSIVAAVSQSRDCCKLKYLTGAAPVVYGLPFYL